MAKKKSPELKKMRRFGLLWKREDDLSGWRTDATNGTWSVSPGHGYWFATYCCAAFVIPDGHFIVAARGRTMKDAMSAALFIAAEARRMASSGVRL